MTTSLLSGNRNNILRYPRLDTILMMEAHIKRFDGEYKKKKLWESLPKKMMYQTFCLILEYLMESNKVSIDAQGKVGWIYYPKLVKSSDKSLRWKK